MSERDAVFFLHNKMIIRVFKKLKGKAKRFGGLPKDDLKEIYESKQNEFFKRVVAFSVREVLEKELDLKNR